MKQRTIRRWSNPETILVATNLLEGSSVILHTVYQARLSRAKILLVHVVRPSPLRTNPTAGVPFVQPSPALLEVQARLDQMARAYQREGILCEPIILSGTPTEQIPLLVRSRGVDRVVVATRSPRGVERLLMGSVAEQLAAAMDVPVCIVGHGAHRGSGNDSSPRRILVATSFRPSSSLCVSFACAFAEEHRTHLTLLHVLESVRMGTSQIEEVEIAARQELATCITLHAKERCQIDLEIRVGDPATEILKVANLVRHDFITLGSPPDSIVSRILGSSVIHRVVSEADCPVLTIKPLHSAVMTSTDGLLHTEPVRINPDASTQNFL